MHEETDLLNCIGDIRPSEGEPLQCSRKAAIIRGILDRWSVGRQLRVDVDRSGGRLALSHPGALQKLQHILALRENQRTMALNMHAQEVMELSQVLHGELRLHRSDGALKELGRRSCEDYVVDIQ